MDGGWSLVPYAHVRAALIVECNEASDVTACSLEAGIEGLPVELFGLDYSIDSLCDAVVCRLVILCHAYLDIVG